MKHIKDISHVLVSQPHAPTVSTYITIIQHQTTLLGSKPYKGVLYHGPISFMYCSSGFINVACDLFQSMQTPFFYCYFRCTKHSNPSPKFHSARNKFLIGSIFKIFIPAQFQRNRPVPKIWPDQFENENLALTKESKFSKTQNKKKRYIEETAVYCIVKCLTQSNILYRK